MAFTDEQKVERIKRILIRRIENIGDLATLKTLIKNMTWTKIKNFLNVDFDSQADQLDIDSQDQLDEKADILALKAEKDTF